MVSGRIFAGKRMDGYCSLQPPICIYTPRPHPLLVVSAVHQVKHNPDWNHLTFAILPRGMHQYRKLSSKHRNHGWNGTNSKKASLGTTCRATDITCPPVPFPLYPFYIARNPLAPYPMHTPRGTVHDEGISGIVLAHGTLLDLCAF